MKLIALKDFRNVPALRLREDDGKGNFKSALEDARHDDHVHKGAVFDIGAAKDLAAMRKNDAPTAQIVAQLFVAGCVGDANDPKIVSAVKDSIAADVEREKARKKLDTAADGSAMLKQMTELLAKANAAATK